MVLLLMPASSVMLALVCTICLMSRLYAHATKRIGKMMTGFLEWFMVLESLPTFDGLILGICILPLLQRKYWKCAD
jgi:hypothetical protein